MRSPVSSTPPAYLPRGARSEGAFIWEKRVMTVSEKRDYYEILGVRKDADAAAIKKAYRKLAKKYHPDTNAGNAHAEEEFKKVTEAYDVLSDEKKRKLYDTYGHAAFDGSAAGADPFGQNAGGRGAYSRSYDGSGGSYREYHFEGGDVDMDDIFGDMFGSGFHRSGFGGFGGRSFRRKGSDLNAEVEVSFDEAAFGGKKLIHLQDSTSGEVRSYEVNIPAGIEDGKTIRLRGKGMPGSGGGEDGDLMLTVRVKEKPGFRREGLDVYTTVKVPFTTAVFGGEVPIDTLYGRVMCRIREGTQSGTKIRLAGKGIVSMKNASVHGDQYASVEIDVPRRLNPEAKQKLREYERAC